MVPSSLADGDERRRAIQKQGGRRLPRTIDGGRPVVSSLLYRRAPFSLAMQAFEVSRARLDCAGNPAKAATKATTRKLLGILNAMLAASTEHQHRAWS